MNTSVTAATLRDLLQESLLLWGVEGDVVIEDAALIVRGEASAVIVRKNIEDNTLVRWLVSSQLRGDNRPCTSILGVLSSVRATLVPNASIVPRIRVSREPFIQ